MSIKPTDIVFIAGKSWFPEWQAHAERWPAPSPAAPVFVIAGTTAWDAWRAWFVNAMARPIDGGASAPPPRSDCAPAPRPARAGVFRTMWRKFFARRDRRRS